MSINTFTAFRRAAKGLNGNGLDYLATYEPEMFEVSDIEKDDVVIETEGIAITDERTKEAIETLAEFMHLTPTQTILMVGYLYEQTNEVFNGLEGVTKFLGLSAIDAIPLKAERDNLRKMGYLRLDTRRNRYGFCMQVDPTLATAILQNKPFAISAKPEPNRYELCKQASIAACRKMSDSIDVGELLREVFDLEEQMSELEFVQNVRRQLSDITDRAMFYELCYNYQDDDPEIPLNGFAKLVTSTESDRRHIIMEFMHEEHPLVKKNLAMVSAKSEYANATIRLSTLGIKLLLEDDLFQTTNDALLKSPQDIVRKEMFYDVETCDKVKFLNESLASTQFKKLQKRLKAKKLPIGVTAILYGAPGTGKTETCLQIAKTTGRKVMHVDISESKSCWYGESEKRIKKIFTDYKMACYKEKRTPILLFNEADAIFSKRKDTNFSSTAQTENTIQNIILEELEHFEGILIATTNLADNLDEAFDRRFLFKIKFDRPSMMAKSKIWHYKVPSLSDDECMTLASKHDLSGGEIDNVVRKATMDEVLHGTKISADSLSRLSKEEKMHTKQNTRLGF